MHPAQHKGKSHENYNNDLMEEVVSRKHVKCIIAG